MVGGYLDKDVCGGRNKGRLFQTKRIAKAKT